MIATSDESQLDPQDLLDRARAGDQAAWEELFHTCYPKVIRVVRRKLNRPLRALYDSTDFASDVMKSLVDNLDRLDFPSIHSLMAFLAQAAEKKVIDEYRRRHTQKRDIKRERALASGDESEVPSLALVSGEPTASQVAQAREVRDRLLAGQDEDERRIIELKQLGYSNAEIAEETGWNIRKVQRFFKNLHDTLGGPEGNES